MRRFTWAGIALAAFGCAHAGPAPDPTGTLALRKAMAQELVARGDLEGAFPLVDGMHRDAPRDAGVLAMRGVIFREQGLLVEAEADLRDAVRLAPEDAAAHAALGVTLDSLGRHDDAAVHHRTAVDLQPDDPGYLNNLAFSCSLRGRLDETLELYAKALRLAPTDARIRNNFGFALARAGDFSGAAMQFSRAGSPAEARNNLGVAYELAGNLRQAWEQFVLAARLEERPGQGRRNLEALAQRLGRPMPAGLAGRSAEDVSDGRAER